MQGEKTSKTVIHYYYQGDKRKVKTQKSIAHLYTIQNWNWKLKIQHHLHEHQKKKYLVINWTKYIHNPYEENCKSLMKETQRSL